MYMPEQNSSFYFLCNTLTLTFSTKTYRIYFPYPSYKLLITTCCLYRLPSCPESNYNLFQIVHNGIQNIFKYRALHSPWLC